MKPLTTLLTLAIVLSALTLQGCGFFQRGEATLTGWANVCVDGVAYIQFRNGASVKYNVDGSIQLC